MVVVLVVVVEVVVVVVVMAGFLGAFDDLVTGVFFVIVFAWEEGAILGIVGVVHVAASKCVG